MAIEFFREVGLTPKQVVMKISSRSVLAALLRASGFAEAQLDALYPVLDKRDQLQPQELLKAIDTLGVTPVQRGLLLRLGEAKGPGGLTMLAEMVGDDPEGKQRYAELTRLFDLLGDMGVAPYCTFDMGVVRGLAYYTGPVFEAFGTGALRRAICGGGRYGDLLETVGGPTLSAVGFGTSDVVIQDLLEEFGLLQLRPRGRAVFVVDADPKKPELFRRVLAITAELRRRKVTASYSYRRQALGKQLRQANDKNTRRVIIVEEGTLTDGTVSLKDMRSGTQRALPLEAVLDDPFQPLDSP